MTDISSVDNTREKILSFIKDRDSKRVTLTQLRTAINDKDLEKILYKMIQSGELVYANKKYKLNDPQVYQGRVFVRKSGVKFVHMDNGKDITISQSSSPYVLQKDVVDFRLVGNEAFIFNIVSRALNEQVFQVVIKNGNKTLEYSNGDFYLKVPNDALDEYVEGEYLLVDISDNTFKGVVKRIANLSDPNNRDLIIAYNHGFDNDYEDDYMTELSEIKMEVSEDELAGRHDFRKTRTVTIDCDNTRDMDDALSEIVLLPNGNRLLTGHIASVSEYVKFMGVIFNKAAKRGNSLYTSRYVFPMFHYLISNGICSLNPGVDRLTKSLTLEIDPDGNVVNRKLEYGVINSDYKMKYSEVDKIFTDPDNIDPDYVPFIEMLTEMKSLSDIMGKRLRKGGKIDFASREYSVQFNEEGDAEKANPLDSPISRKIIENFMLYLNWQFAIILMENELPVWYRVHSGPNPQSLDRVMVKIKSLGYDISMYERTGNLQTFLNCYEDNPIDYIVITSLILPYIGRAHYSGINTGHFGLGLPIYAQFSSDIRRVTDLLNHYSADILLSRNYENKEALEAMIDSMSEHATEMEKQADDAEKESLSYDLLEIAQKNLGYDFLGLVTEVKFGKAYVRLDNGVYGIIDNSAGILVMGDRISARIEDINYNKKEVYLTFIDMINSRKVARKKIKKLFK